jgi:hypothetical protein
VESAKITGYLLKDEAKSRFFVRFGFNEEEWLAFAEALIAHAKSNEVVRVREAPFGRLYSVEGNLDCPDGRRPFVRTVWNLAEERAAPRFVTAYPAGDWR